MVWVEYVNADGRNEKCLYPTKLLISMDAATHSQLNELPPDQNLLDKDETVDVGTDAQFSSEHISAELLAQNDRHKEEEVDTASVMVNSGISPDPGNLEFVLAANEKKQDVSKVRLFRSRNIHQPKKASAAPNAITINLNDICGGSGFTFKEVRRKYLLSTDKKGCKEDDEAKS